MDKEQSVTAAEIAESNRVRTSVILTSPRDSDPKSAGQRRRRRLQERAAEYGYLSFSELARDFADGKTELVKSLRIKEA